MKILHIGSLRTDYRNSGVITQLKYEIEASKILALEYEDFKFDTVFLVSVKKLKHEFIIQVPLIVRPFILRRIYYLYYIFRASKNYDVILFRYSIADPFFLALKSRRAKLYSVHHTNELNLIKKKYIGILGKIIHSIENISGKYILKKVTGIIGVTEEIACTALNRLGIINNKINLVYHNGIIYGEETKIDVNNEIIKIVFLNTDYQIWQGLDLLLDDIGSNSHLKNKFSIDIIGHVNKDLEFIINKLIIEGFKISHVNHILENEVAGYLNQFDVGLAAFSLNKIGLKMACTLKVREYLSAGLPVFSGHVDSALPNDYPYYVIGPPKIKLILDSAVKFKFIGKSVISESAKPYLDKVSLMRNIYLQLKK